MKLQIDNKEYPIEIEKKRTNKNTYIRVKKKYDHSSNYKLFYYWKSNQKINRRHPR